MDYSGQGWPRATAPTLGMMALAALMLGAPGSANAETEQDRFSAAGYFRVMARPDFDGGWSQLGLWNINGRLLNEGPYAALELKLDALDAVPGSGDPWTSLHAKIEGGSLLGADPGNGSLAAFALTQLYVKAGDVLIEDVVFQVGSLLTSFGDSGYALRRDQYSTILTFGGAARLRVVDGLELGLGAEIFHEPPVRGNRFGPHRTILPTNVSYEDFVRGRVVERYIEANPGRIDDFPRPEPVAADSYKVVGYLGFGDLGPLRWNNLFVNVARRHPDNFTTEVFEGRQYRIFLKELTDQRVEINGGNEMQLTLVPGLLDAAWGVLFGFSVDEDDKITASERNRTFYSTVLRLQLYMTDTLHLLAEGSAAREESRQGNLWRGHHDSVFTSTSGLADSEGLEFGDLYLRDTNQLKFGLIINPTGPGIFTRPSLRILYGIQKSNMHNAFGNSFIESLDDFNEFKEDRDRLWHSVIALEAEAWF